MPRSPWQRLYGLGHRIRHNYWKRRAVRLPRPVISIGNVHWGGTGKTPLVAALANHLLKAGEEVAILTRGYGSRGKGIRIVPPTADTTRHIDPNWIGDEPALLAELLPKVAIVVSPDRSASARQALEELSLSPTVFLLDDGFSHLPLARDLDLLAFPNADPFGGARLWPTGRLREPLFATNRADAALLTGGEGEATTARARSLSTALQPFGFEGPAFAAPLSAGIPTYAGGGNVEAGEVVEAGAPVLLVTGIARPERVLKTAQSFDVEIRDHMVFPDHHEYPEPSLDRIREAFRNSGATAVLVTSKDRVKLDGRCDLPLAELAVESRPETAFWTWFDERWGQIRDQASRPSPSSRTKKSLPESQDSIDGMTPR